MLQTVPADPDHPQASPDSRLICRSPDELRYFKECILQPTISHNIVSFRLGGVGKSTCWTSSSPSRRRQVSEEDAPRCS